MERYTYFDSGKFRLKIDDTEYSGDWVDRLAAYEETGLEPEDMKRAFNEDAILKLAGQALGMSPARLRELAQAEKDGRLRIVGVPKGACCGTCVHFEREAGTSHGACKPENHNWIAQSRIACKGHYTPISEAALKEREAEHDR